MNESIEVSLERVERCIAEFESREFTTADVIRKYLGHFCSDIGTPAAHSFNAQFGKLLKRNEMNLGIAEIANNQRVRDDHDHMTSTSRWRKNT